MKSRINLYHAEFYPKFEWVRGSHLIVLSLLAFVLSGAAYAVLYAWQNSVQQEYDAVALNISQRQANIDEFTQALQTRTSNPVLDAKLNQLRDKLAAQESLLNRVKGMSELKQKSFSQLFDALATANSDHVWLTSFTVDGNDLTVSGNLAKPSGLTNWIADLSKTRFFSGQEFDDALVIRDEDGLSFQLTSKEKTEKVLVAKGANNGEE